MLQVEPAGELVNPPGTKVTGEEQTLPLAA